MFGSLANARNPCFYDPSEESDIFNLMQVWNGESTIYSFTMEESKDIMKL